MRMFTKAAILVAALAIPAATFAQATTTPKETKKSSAAKETGKAAVANHSTSGTVKSVSDTQLVISKGTGKNEKDETFTVNASTKKTGDVATGSKVTVAYTMDGSNMVATSIKAAAAHSGSSKKSSTKK